MTETVSSPLDRPMDGNETECPCTTWNDKEIVLHNQHVAKLSRLDLENRFLQVYEDNIHLKRECNNLRDQLKRLGTKVYRLIESHKTNPNCLAGGYERQALTAGLLLTEQTHRIAILEAENERWRAKVEAMRQQFLSYRNFSINQKPRQMKRQNSAKHDAHLEQEIERLKENLKKMDKTVKMLQSGGESDDTSGIDVSGRSKGINKIRGEQRRNSETDLEEQRLRVESDVELIKAKRQMAAQSDEIVTLKERISFLLKELETTKEALDASTLDCEELKEQVQKHIQKVAELQHEMIELHQYQQRVKDLTEQIRDLQLEKEELKAHAAQLLQLSTSVGGSARSSADNASSGEAENVAALRQRVTSLEASLVSEKAERVSVEATLKEEQHQLVQLRMKSQEMKVLQEEMEKCLQSERLSAATAKIYQKEAEDMRTLNQKLESKYHVLEEMLKDAKKPCQRCLLLEKELKDSKEPCKRCLQLEKELQAVSSHFQHSTDVAPESGLMSQGNGLVQTQSPPLAVGVDSQLPATNVLMSGRGDAPVRRYPTLEQSRAVLGLPKRNSSSRTSVETSTDTVISPRSEEGQGDHPRKTSPSQMQARSDVSLLTPSVSASPLPGSSLPISAFLSLYNNGESIQEESCDNVVPNMAHLLSSKDQELIAMDSYVDSSTEVRFLEKSLQLDKCREMLRVQYNLNKLYKKEIDNLAKDVSHRNIKNMNGRNKR